MNKTTQFQAKYALGVSSRRQPRPLAAGLSAAISLMALSAGAPNAAVLNVPTGASERSNLFGAAEFSARVVLFEEFGLKDYKEDPNHKTLPPPLDPLTGELDCLGNPTLSALTPAQPEDAQGAKLDALVQSNGLYPMPGEFADELTRNPWESQVKTCNPATAAMAMPADGRPYGNNFKFQRWNEVNAKGELEFQPKAFFQTMLAGARVSRGARDDAQSHGYGAKTNGKFSEFGPTGLYYNTVTSPYAAPVIDPFTKQQTGAPGPLYSTLTAAEKLAEKNAIGYVSAFEKTTKGIPVQVHPYMPIQDRNSVWTFDGTIPAKLLMSRYGESILLRNHNALPIDEAANNAFGTHTISTHAHNVHNPAESDGYAGAWFYPGQYFDYNWPQILAGHDTINTQANDPRAALPCEPNVENVHGVLCPADGKIKVPGDYRETQSTLWFHDHMEDFTAQNVYKGNAAMMNNYSAIDRGNEEFNDGVNLRFPSGTARSWGNRDYDVNLVIADKAFDQSGQLWFNPLNKGGFLGDVMTVNWVYKPYMDVRARKYRFRLLNGSVSRYMKIAVVDSTGAQVPFHMIANDGNILEHSVAFPHALAGTGLPTQSIAERYDIIVDFAPLYARGIRKVYLVNLMEHAVGDGPKAPVTLAQAWNAFNGNAKTGYNGQDLAIGKFMEFRLRPLPAGQTDKSMNPAEYTETVVDPVTKKSVAGKIMLPRPTFTPTELKTAKHRTFVYGKKPDAIDDGKPWILSTDGGPGYNADLARISAAPVKNSVEIWHLVGTAGGWSHPAHIHFEEGQIIYKNGVAPPPWEKFARKDMYRLGPEFNSAVQLDVVIRVRDLAGTFVQHCHNTQHEDNAMLLRWDSESQQSKDNKIMVQTPHPDWAGAHYDQPSFKLPTADTGSTRFDAKTGTNLSSVSSFTPPANWGTVGFFGGRAADVPVTSAPAP